MGYNIENEDFLKKHSKNYVYGSTHDSVKIGLRVPINNTGVSGKKAGLKSHSSEQNIIDDQRQGSLNRAVIETYKIKGGLFGGDDTDPNDDAYKAKHGVFSEEELAQFINMDMMYGYMGDARMRAPGDGMSYRGYPTPVVAESFHEVKVYTANIEWNPDGSVDFDPEELYDGRFLILRTGVTLKYPVPFDYIFKVKISHVDNANVDTETSPNFTNVYMKIKAGDLGASSYCLADPYANVVTWNGLQNGEYITSIDTEGITETDLTYKAKFDTYYQLSYGATDGTTIELVIPKNDYDPPAPEVNNYFGQPFKSSIKLNPESEAAFITRVKNSCSEIGSWQLYEANGYTSPPTNPNVFVTKADGFGIGEKLLTSPTENHYASPGLYVWVHEITPVDEESRYFDILRLAVVDATGTITDAWDTYNDGGKNGADGCYLMV